MSVITNRYGCIFQKTLILLLEISFKYNVNLCTREMDIIWKILYKNPQINWSKIWLCDKRVVPNQKNLVTRFY
jgi:hypothetical protein